MSYPSAVQLATKSPAPFETCNKLLLPVTVPRVAPSLLTTRHLVSIGSIVNEITRVVPCVIDAHPLIKNAIEETNIRFFSLVHSWNFIIYFHWSTFKDYKIGPPLKRVFPSRSFLEHPPRASLRSGYSPWHRVFSGYAQLYRPAARRRPRISSPRPWQWDLWHRQWPYS